MLDVILDLGTLKVGQWSIPLRLHGYGLMLVLGFLLGIALGRWRAHRTGENPETLAHCGVLAMIGGVAGARIAYIIQHWDTQFAYIDNQLGAILNITSGGLIYYGGVVLATILVLGYLRIKRLPIRRYLDILAVPLMIGLAFGRAGCLLHGCCYGAPSRPDFALAMRFPMYSRPLVKINGADNPFCSTIEAPSAVYAHQLQVGDVRPDPRLVDTRGRLIPPREFNSEQIALAQKERSLPVLPAQALGIVNALLIAGILFGFFRLRRHEGEVFALMLVLYPVTRFILESIRADNPHDLLSGQFTHNQFTSIVVFIAGGAMMVGLRSLGASAGETWAQRIAPARKQKTTRKRDRKR